MQFFQWVIAAVRAILPVVVAFLQWHAAEQKVVLDLSDRRRVPSDESDPQVRHEGKLLWSR
jgi:hypothetical protein